jgi:hypothetical protein
MNSSQQSQASIDSNVREPGADATIEDENEIPLGCECANPALQIERWGQEAPPGPSQTC